MSGTMLIEKTKAGVLKKEKTTSTSEMAEEGELSNLEGGKRVSGA